MATPNSLISRSVGSTVDTVRTARSDPARGSDSGAFPSTLARQVESARGASAGAGTAQSRSSAAQCAESRQDAPSPSNTTPNTAGTKPAATRSDRTDKDDGMEAEAAAASGDSKAPATPLADPIAVPSPPVYLVRSEQSSTGAGGATDPAVSDPGVGAVQASASSGATGGLVDLSTPSTDTAGAVGAVSVSATAMQALSMESVSFGTGPVIHPDGIGKAGTVPATTAGRVAGSGTGDSSAMVEAVGAAAGGALPTGDDPNLAVVGTNERLAPTLAAFLIQGGNSDGVADRVSQDGREGGDTAVAALTAPAGASVATAVPKTGQTAYGATASLAQPMGWEAWNEELGQHVLWMVDSKLGTAEVKLNPAHLGPLEVRIRMDHDQASIQFTAQQGSVREALEAAVPKLRDMLGAQHIGLADVSVQPPTASSSMESHGQGGAFDRQQQARFAGGSGTVSGMAAEPGENSVNTDRTATIGLVNFYA